MLQEEIRDLLGREPFEPFRIKVASGDAYDVFYPRTLAILDDSLFYVPPDQNWALIPASAISSLESLIADYHGFDPQQ